MAIPRLLRILLVLLYHILTSLVRNFFLYSLHPFCVEVFHFDSLVSFVTGLFKRLHPLRNTLFLEWGLFDFCGVQDLLDGVLIQFGLPRR